MLGHTPDITGDRDQSSGTDLILKGTVIRAGSGTYLILNVPLSVLGHRPDITGDRDQCLGTELILQGIMISAWAQI